MKTMYFILFKSLFVLGTLSRLSNGSVVAIPPPNGTFGVNIRTMKLTDTSRFDPFAPTPENRSAMLSVFYPVAFSKSCNIQLAEYMPPTTAAVEDQSYAGYGLPNGTFESLYLSLCHPSSSSYTTCADDFPLVIFSPGLGNSRLIYNAIAQSVSSYGYTVVTVDHPYDADIVEYPDGTFVLAANISTGEQIELSVETRVKDISFILDQLSIPSTTNGVLPLSKKGFKTSRVAMFGHSLGGAATASTMVNDSRIIGGINLDGTFFGPVIEEGVDNPFILFGHDGKNQSTDSTWGDIWPNLHIWKLELMLSGAQHATFTDFPLLLEVLGLANQIPGAADLIGTVPGTRALEIITAYLVAFFDSVLKSKPSTLLRAPSKRFPEVEFVAVGKSGGRLGY